jgi:hypothetical protein
MQSRTRLMQTRALRPKEEDNDARRSAGVWYGKALSMSAICAAARRAYQPNSPAQPQLQAQSLTCLTDNGLAWHAARHRLHSFSCPCLAAVKIRRSLPCVRRVRQPARSRSHLLWCNGWHEVRERRLRLAAAFFAIGGKKRRSEMRVKSREPRQSKEVATDVEVKV